MTTGSDSNVLKYHDCLKTPIPLVSKRFMSSLDPCTASDLHQYVFTINDPRVFDVDSGDADNDVGLFLVNL